MEWVRLFTDSIPRIKIQYTKQPYRIRQLHRNCLGIFLQFCHHLTTSTNHCTKTFFETGSRSIWSNVLQHFENYASCLRSLKKLNLFSYGAFVLQYILAHAQQFLTEFSTRQKTGITHVTTHVITCYREKDLCSNMFCCVLSGRDHYKPNLGNDL